MNDIFLFISFYSSFFTYIIMLHYVGQESCGCIFMVSEVVDNLYLT